MRNQASPGFGFLVVIGLLHPSVAAVGLAQTAQTDCARSIYLKKQGSTFQRALAGPGIWDHVLAIIVWHEMAHLDGADECQAQRKEEELWNQFVVERRVDGYRGLNYLRLLRERQCQPSEESIGRG